jgi:hypothetical protein
VETPFHRLLIFWSPGKVQARVQPLTGLLLVLWMTAWAWNPPGQLPTSE